MTAIEREQVPRPPADTATGHVANALQLLTCYRAVAGAEQLSPEIVELIESARLRLTLALEQLRHEEAQ